MRCVLVDPYATRNLHRLDRPGGAWNFVCVAHDDSPVRLADAFGTADAAIAQGWDAELAQYAPDLRLLQLPNAGTDGVDWSVIPQGCIVANAFGHAIPIAEFTLLAMLETRIGVRQLDTTIRKGDWSLSHRTFGPTHGELSGATVGIVGYGRIGRAIAARARAFDMSVVAASRTRPEDPAMLAWSGSMDALEEMLPRCDFLVIACPLTESTRNLIDARRLALLPAGAVIINVARGEIIDEAALFNELKSGRLGGAALDVWWRYPSAADPAPLPFHYPFDTLPNVLMSPHVSAWTEAMLARRWREVADNLDRFAHGLPLRNTVHRDQR